jgi:hypothetical protein
VYALRFRGGVHFAVKVVQHGRFVDQNEHARFPALNEVAFLSELTLLVSL